MLACPTAERLARLLDVDDAGLEAHVGDCPHCQRQLLDLAGDVELIPAAPIAGAPSDDFLRQLLAAVAPPLTAAWPDISGYEILAEIGRGGTGVVFKARQPLSNRLVALKVVRLDTLAALEDRERVRRGAAILAEFQHPHIVRLYEVGEHGDCWYGAIEYIAGGTLAQHLTGAPWHPGRAAELVRILAETLAVVHERGYLHCDLKPANLLVREDGTPLLADFGLARPLHSASSSNLMGTPAYMAPEQALGQDISPATDVHALGVLLYQLLTGAPPYRGPTLMDTLEEVVRRQPPPPSHAAPGVSPEFDTICLKCLHKEPGQRYASAAALATALVRVSARSLSSS